MAASSIGPPGSPSRSTTRSTTCLYLAYAEGAASALITADRKLANKAAGQLPSADVRHIGAAGVAEAITAAATALVISREKVEALSDAYDFVAATERHVVASLRGRHDLPPLLTPEKQKLIVASPSFRRLVDMISALAQEECVDLLALGWLGAGLLNGDWRRIFEHASHMVGQVDHSYAAGYGEYWRKGYASVSGPPRTAARQEPLELVPPPTPPRREHGCGNDEAAGSDAPERMPDGRRHRCGF